MAATTSTTCSRNATRKRKGEDIELSTAAVNVDNLAALVGRYMVSVLPSLVSSKDGKDVFCSIKDCIVQALEDFVVRPSQRLGTYKGTLTYATLLGLLDGEINFEFWEVEDAYKIMEEMEKNELLLYTDIGFISHLLRSIRNVFAAHVKRAMAKTSKLTDAEKDCISSALAPERAKLAAIFIYASLLDEAADFRNQGKGSEFALKKRHKPLSASSPSPSPPSD